ncbi:MAG: ImmA/IrrE family metallo-endopeptidase [Methylococcus sp.]|nr:ImmA/IrrE family metallo-endopeptidase [Methylococcus sp.]
MQPWLLQSLAMERIRSINPHRIAWCCAEEGITTDTLASELRIAPGSMQRVMSGEDGLTFNQLRNIAGYFGRGVLFFLEADPVDAAHVHTAQFRTLANQKPELSAKVKALIERVEHQRSIYRGLREDVDEVGPNFAPPKLPLHDLGAAAETARRWLELTDRNDFDSYRAAVEARGVLVFRTNGYSGKWQIAKESPIQGFTLYDATCPVIVVKKQASEARQSFTLMHELGHLLLHKSSSIDDETDLLSHEGREREANAFAGQLLVPDAFLATIQDTARPAEVFRFDEWLEAPLKAWGVSAEVILRRLLDAGRLLQEDYLAYRNWRSRLPAKEAKGGTRMYRYREPKHLFGDAFVRTILDAMSARQITLTKASAYLDNIKLSDLHQLERHYAGL